MTTRQIIARCLTLDPSRSYCATLDRWYHQSSREHAPAIYTLSVLPGLNNRDCQQFRGKDFAECLTAYEQARKDAAANQQTTEPNDQQ